jgi:hypothetical protein
MWIHDPGRGYEVTWASPVTHLKELWNVPRQSPGRDDHEQEAGAPPTDCLTRRRTTSHDGRPARTP